MNPLRIGLMRMLVHSVGQLSDGVRIACRDGFTSGKMVDYAYRNRPSGKLLIGKLLDWIYLSNKGWQAVRIRKQHVGQLLEWAVHRALEDCQRVLILDVAAGPARYLLERLLKFRGRPVEAVCWDVNEQWLEDGQQSAADLGLCSVLFDRGDAMDSASFRRVLRPPHVVIASGFYEWIDDDADVKRSMKLVHEALRPGGYFVFTFQTGHVDLAMTNTVFPGFGGTALRITPRPAAVVHGWARQLGFRIVRTLSDPWGYHVVTLAHKQ